MADYLKGTVTEAYLRCMSQTSGIVVTPELDVRAISQGSRDTPLANDPQLHLFDRDGTVDEALEDAIATALSGTWDNSPDIHNAYVFVNCAAPGDGITLTDPPKGVSITIEPWVELSELSPDLGIQWDEFDAIGTPVMQYIPIRKEFTISFTQKAIDGKWEAILFGDYLGNFAHHGIHYIGTYPTGYPTLTCFEGKNELGTDIGFQINLVLGRQVGGRWVVMRAKNLCYHACGADISPAAITNRTIEFSGNHGYYYTVPDDGTGRPDVTKFQWALTDGPPIP